MYLVYGAHQTLTLTSTTDSTHLLNEQKLAQANLKTRHNIRTGRKEMRRDVKEGKKRRVAAAVGEQEEGMTELSILTSLYLAEYDVDYTANHHQSIKDVPGVPDIALNMAAYTASRTGGGGWGCRKV